MNLAIEIAASATIIFSAIYSLVVVLFRCGLGVACRNSLKNRRCRGELPFVSVVLSARNERENISDCLNSILAQSYPSSSYEIIAVDDFSSDGTGEIMRKLADESDGRLLVITNDEPTDLTGKQTALDKAISISRGEIILTTDADCIAPPEWISGMVDSFADPTVGVVTGFSTIIDSREYMSRFGFWRRLFLRLQSLELITLFSMFAGGLGLGVATACTGNNLAYRRKVHEEMGGQKSLGRTVADDNMLIQWVARNTDWRISPCLKPETIVTTLPKTSVREFLRQRIRWASNSLENDLPIIFFMTTVYAMNLLVYPLLLLGFAGQIPLWLGVAPMIIKVVPELMIVSKGTNIFGKRHLLRYFPILQPCHTVYILACGFLGIFGKAEWKGRECRAKYR